MHVGDYLRDQARIARTLGEAIPSLTRSMPHNSTLCPSLHRRLLAPISSVHLLASSGLIVVEQRRQDVHFTAPAPVFIANNNSIPLRAYMLLSLTPSEFAVVATV